MGGFDIGYKHKSYRGNLKRSPSKAYVTIFSTYYCYALCNAATAVIAGLVELYIRNFAQSQQQPTMQSHSNFTAAAAVITVWH